MNERKLLWQYGFKLNELKIRKTFISSIGLFIALFVFYTAFDFYFFMNINTDLNINKEISNRTISLELDNIQLYEPLFDLPMVESYEIFEWDPEKTFLFIRLNSYLDVNAFIEAANAQSLRRSYNHSLTSQAKSLLQLQHFMGIFVKLALITSVLMLAYFLYRAFKYYADTLRIMFILGINMHNLLTNYLIKLYSLFFTSCLCACLLEKIFIRQFILKVVFPNTGGVQISTSNDLAHFFIIILSMIIIGTFFLIGVKRDFKSIES